MSVLAQVAVDASAALAAGRSYAFLGRRQEEVRDSPWASDRDSRSAMAAPERLLWLARRDVREQRPVQRLRDAWQTVACRMPPQASEVLLAVQIPRVASPKALLVLPQSQAVESELLLALSLRAHQASQLEARPRVQELAPCMPVEPQPPALPVRSALLPAQQERQAHSVSQRVAQRSLAEAPLARQASSARPSQPLPWFLFPL
jgi:hypothetical protein